MQAVVLPAILVVLCAFFKAVADTLTHHFDTSVFKWRDRRWWDPSVSWKYAGFLRFTRYRLDAWHLANSLQLAGWLAALATAPRSFPWWQVFAAGALLFILVFNLFYNKILRR